MEITLRETERQKRRMADLKSASANALNSVFMQLRQQLSKLWQRAAANYPRVAEVGSTRGGLGNAGENGSSRMKMSVSLAGKLCLVS